jgi:toxin-antitoxin system PIN domain toxin
MPATPAEALLDVNVLIAAVFEDHEAHARAKVFVESLRRFATTPTTQGGFLRFATRSIGGKPPGLSMEQAMSQLKVLTGNANHVFLGDVIPFMDVDERSIQGHRQWTDAYLLTCARYHGIAFATLDEKMKRLDDSNRPMVFVLL